MLESKFSVGNWFLNLSYNCVLWINRRKDEEPEVFKIRNSPENPWDVLVNKFWYGEDVWIYGESREGFSARYFSGYSTIGIPVDDFKEFFTRIEPDRDKYRILGTPFLAWAWESRNEFKDFEYQIGTKNITISRFEVMIRIDKVWIFYIYPLDQEYIILGIPSMRGVPLTFDYKNKTVSIYNQTEPIYNRDDLGGIKWIIVTLSILAIFVVLFIIWCYQRTIRHRKQRLLLNDLLNELDPTHDGEAK